MKYVFGTVHDFPEVYPETGEGRAANVLTGIDEETQSGFSVYPNPTRSSLTVHNGYEENGSYLIQLKDLSGRLIYANFIKPGETKLLELKDYADGLYLIDVTKNNKEVVYRNRLVKQE